MTGQDALDHVGGKPKFTKKDKREYAKKKSEEDLAAALKDPKAVQEGSQKFNEKINEAREKAGLPVTKKKKVAPKHLPVWVDTKRFDTIEVKVDLTQDEKNAAGQELAHKKQQLDQVDLERKSRMAAFKDQMDEIRAKMSDLSNKVTLGYEYRKFSCQLFLDFKTKERVYKDRETGRELKRCSIEADDYQMRMPI